MQFIGPLWYNVAVCVKNKLFEEREIFMNYDKLKNKYDRQYKANVVIGFALIVVGALTIAVRTLTAVLLVLIGLALLLMTRKNRERNFKEIEKIQNPADFNQSMLDSGLDMPEFSLYLCNKYAVSELKGLKVHVLRDMNKFEVGIAGDKKKTLFLTDKNKVRYEIASTVKGDKRQKSFDEVYLKVKDIFDNKRYR